MTDEIKDIVNLDSIELNLTTSMVCSNFNRLCILYLLKKSPENEMQAEKIASNLGISHRTALYHLDILHDYELVEVREFRKKGSKLLRSVWGLNAGNRENLSKIFSRIKRKFKMEELEKMITLNDKNPRNNRKELIFK